MKVYLNDDENHVGPWPHNDILIGLKTHCTALQVGEKVVFRKYVFDIYQLQIDLE